MTLNDKVPFLLDACARAMAAGEDLAIDLTALFPTFCRKDGMIEVVQALINDVERYSEGVRSVRLAHKELFKHKIKIIGLYLACCSADTPKGIVSEVSEGVQLVSLRPFGNGLTVGAECTSYSNDTMRLGHDLEAYFGS